MLRLFVMARIRTGTASWTDPGFVADWYPPKLPARDRLRWYAEHFNYVEVNATFYALPEARTVVRWCEETPADFLFDVKLPRVLSRHRMEAKFLPPDLRTRVPQRNGVVQLTPDSESLIMSRLHRELRPLRDAGKLGAFLLQLSPSFRPKTHELLELDSIRPHLGGVPLAVELRNRDWVMGPQLDATLQYFRDRRMTLVSVDAPASEHFTVMPGNDYVTNPRLGYVRLHGRNATGYLRGRSVAERFDYDYSDAEVEELAARLGKIAQEVKELRIVANNNRSNYAPKLAERLAKLLGLERELRKTMEATLARSRKAARQQELF
jgi:uncharacterized protein YecE (DUF72 family)